EVRRPYASPIKLVFWIAVLGLVFAGMASASRRPSLMEEYAMVVGNVSTGGRSSVWALVSTRNPHYGVVFAKPCHAAPALAIPVLRMLGSSDVRRWIGPTAWWPRRSFAPRFDGRSSECVGSPLSRCGGTCLPPFARTSAAATAALVAAPDTPEEAHRAQRRRTSFPERPLPHGAGR